MFRINPSLESQLAGQAEFAEAVAEAAEPAREHAERFAGRPWMPRKGARRSIELLVEDGQVLLANTDHGGHLKEYGGRSNAPHAPLRRGVQAAGLRLGESE